MALLVSPTLFSAYLSPNERLEPAFQPPQRVYNYTPCLVQTRGVLHAWYCANRMPGDVTDYLCHRTARRRGGSWVWSDENVALEPAPRGKWDSRHVCDPEVVAGSFRYQSREWQYAMLYLGCDAERSTHNQIGVAFANSLEGPWHRYPDPIVRYTADPQAGIAAEHLGWPVYRFWGVGQPAAISLDRRGKLLLLFSRGEQTWGEQMVELNLSNMDRGPQASVPRPVPTIGLHGKDGRTDVTIVNVGVALNEKQDRLYMVREELPPADNRFPGFISASVQVARISWSALRSGQGRWTVLGHVDSTLTGWPRNHNASIVKDPFGRITDASSLTLGVSVAESFAVPPPDFAWLWTYRIGLLRFPLPRTE